MSRPDQDMPPGTQEDGSAPEDAAGRRTRRLNILASQWMKQGIALLEKNTGPGLREALVFFDRAIELRSSLPISEDPWIRYGLAAGWMNRGDVLTRLGNPDNWTDAVRSYDRALTLLEALPPGRHVLFRKRHMIAWMNRGITLMRMETPFAIRDAQDSFERARLLLRDATAGDPDFPALGAAIHLNLAGVLLQLDPPRPREALHAAREIIALARPAASEQAALAEVLVKARQLVCQAVSILLDEPALSDRERHELLDEATDQVEAGLELVRAWRDRGHVELEAAGDSLFRFGAFAYKNHQPRFLDEFIREHLLDSGRRKKTVLEIIRMEWARLGRGPFAVFDSPAYQLQLSRLSFIRECGKRLDAISGIPMDRACT